MKTSNKKAVLALTLASLIALVGCEPAAGEDSSVANPSSTPVESSVDTTEVDMQIKLERSIYLVGETELDVVSVMQYSEALQDYKPVKNFTYEFDSSTPGTKEVTFYAGVSHDTVEIEVYATGADAAGAHPIEPDSSKAFVESDYIDVAKKKLEYDTYIETNGTEKSYKSFTYKKRVDVENKIANNLDPSNTDGWNAAVLTSFTETYQTATLDATRYCIPHKTVDDVVSTYTSHQWYEGGYEFYFDADGRIAWCQPVNADYPITPSDTTGFYSNSKYTNNLLNPVFKFASDYDPTSDTAKLNFEKVIPTGGFALICKQRGNVVTGMDAVWNKMSGETVTFNSTNEANIFTNNNRAKAVDDARAFYDNMYVNIYIPSNNGQIFAYYYLQVLEGSAVDSSKWAEALAYKDTVISSMNLETALASNELVKKEPVLAEYYESLTAGTLDAWIELIEAASN